MQVEAISFVQKNEFVVCKSELTGETWESKVALHKKGEVTPPEGSFDYTSSTFNAVVVLDVDTYYVAGLDGRIYSIPRSIMLAPSKAPPKAPGSSMPMVLDKAHNMPISSLDLNKDKLLSGSWDCNIHIYQLTGSSGQFISEKTGHQDFVFDVKCQTSNNTKEPS
eukprot:TRINITY_DN835_c0_g1_i4.p1 TRINITY_DN835_c0_g1~~TRINITY_DN835_c0_g1_i4.p1  ORF type:complete len:165 (+),score=27.81 TRINITY_DN835_c0_g1_i4:61-555(+)